MPAPEKISTHITASSPSKSTHPRHKPKPVQMQVKAPRVKTYHNYQQTKQQAPATPAYRDEDFQLIHNADNSGIKINVMYQGNLIYQFLLLCTDYDLWQSPAFGWAQKYEFVQARVPSNVFLNDNRLIHNITRAIVDILNAIFAKAHAIAMQQAYAQAQMQQAQAQAQAQMQAQQAQQVKRRV